LAKHKFAINDREFEVEVGARRGSRVQVTVNGSSYDVELRSAAVLAHVAVSRPPPAPSVRPPANSAATQASAAGDASLRAPMAGLVLNILVAVGDQVQPGDEVLSLEAMKMENAITAERFGTVSRIAVEPNQVVNQGDVLIEFE
jgi:biotin carboxyl carrier protein